MMMKIGLALALCLCLCCALIPALAAPARDIQVMDVMLDEGLTNLVTIINAAIPEECYSFEETGAVLEDGKAPDPVLVAQAITAAVLYTQPTTVLSREEAENLYHQLFTYGEFDVASKANQLYFLTLTEDGVETHPERLIQDGGAGQRIYFAAFDGTDVTLKCDQFYMEYANIGGYQAVDVEELPEDTVTWVCNVEMTMRFAPETVFGYTLSSLSVSPVYADGNLTRWQEIENTRYEYSVNLPSILGLAEDDPAHMSWQTGDGEASLTIDVEEGGMSYDVALSRFMQANPGVTVDQARDFGYFSALTEDCYILVCADEGINWTYTITLRFPPERQAEYSLYAEFIRNSMIVWGLSNG